jgi:hypothetical protein
MYLERYSENLRGKRVSNCGQNYYYFFFLEIEEWGTPM